MKRWLGWWIAIWRSALTASNASTTSRRAGLPYSIPSRGTYLKPRFGINRRVGGDGLMFGSICLLREKINQDVSKYFYLSTYHAYRRSPAQGSTHFDDIKITAVQFLDPRSDSPDSMYNPEDAIRRMTPTIPSSSLEQTAETFDGQRK